MTSARQVPVVIAGGGPVALLTALFLHKAGREVALVDPSFADETAPFINPDMGLIGGDDTLSSLTLQALEAWSEEADVLGETGLTVVSWADVATTPAVATRLKEEAMLDLIAGYGVSFQEAPAGFSQQVKGAKVWAEAPLLPPDMLLLLRKAVKETGLMVYTDATVALDITQPEAPVVHLASGIQLTASPLVVASAHAATGLMQSMGLALPLRPACGHVIPLTLPQPATPQIVLNRLKKGHLWLLPTERNAEGEPSGTAFTLYYDALNDPTQARYGTSISADVAGMLVKHMAGLLPALQGATQGEATGVTHWVTPDFLPLLGGWGSASGLMLATGWGSREAFFAPLAARWLATLITEPQASPPPALADMVPNRFATGLWQRVDGPGTLKILLGNVIRRSDNRKFEYMENVQIAGKTEIVRASTVQNIEKQTHRAQQAAIAEEPRVKEKPHIQTAATAREPRVKEKPRIQTASTIGEARVKEKPRIQTAALKSPQK